MAKKRKKKKAHQEPISKYDLKLDRGRTICHLCGNETTGKVTYQAYDKQYGVVTVCKLCFISWTKKKTL